MTLERRVGKGREPNGTERNGTEQNGTGRNGTERDGTGRNGTEREGATVECLLLHLEMDRTLPVVDVIPRLMSRLHRQAAKRDLQKAKRFVFAFIVVQHL